MNPKELMKAAGDMQKQGMSPNQVVQALVQQGNDIGQVNDAMNQANMMNGAPGQPQPGQQMPPPMDPGGLPPPGGMPPMGSPPPMGAPPPMGSPASMGGPVGAPMGNSQGGEVDDMALSSAQFEEIAESIIEEKWTDLMKNVNKIVEWKNQMDARFVQIEQKFQGLQHNFDELHKAVVGKINDYDQNILNVGSQVQAMEKVFSKVLPKFTETVNELSRVTGFVKTGKVPSTPKPKQEAPANDNKQDGIFSSDEDVEIPHELLHNL